jgi:hypothetical protein
MFPQGQLALSGYILHLARRKWPHFGANFGGKWAPIYSG